MAGPIIYIFPKQRHSPKTTRTPTQVFEFYVLGI